MGLLVSPAEPAQLRKLGSTHSLPEANGVDFICSSPSGLVGIQRKTVKDFVASVHGDRLSKEAMQSTKLHIAILLLEGRPKVTADGDILGVGYRFTIAQLRGLLWSFRAEGWWVDFSENMADTARYLQALAKWAKKPEHTSLRRRPKEKNPWGKRGSRDQQAFALQAVDGLGYKNARSIVDAAGGQALQLTLSPQELKKVDGIGPARIKSLTEVFGRD